MPDWKVARRSLQNRRNIRSALAANVEVGHDFRIGVDSVLWAPRRLTIGSGCFFGSRNRLEVDGKIGDDVLFANDVAVVGRRDHDIHEVGVPITRAKRVHEHADTLSEPVDIGSDVWVGFRATILSGVRIGDSAVIAAGALVLNDVPANTIVGGVPASPIRQRYSPRDLEIHWRELGLGRGANEDQEL